MSAVTDKHRELQSLGVEVFSVSVDSHFVHKMWNDHELSKVVGGGVPFHMLSDQAGNIGRAYGVYDEGMGIELRGRFIIDPDGVIQVMEVLTPPVGRMLAETVRQIQAYQPVRASKGSEATPAGWLPESRSSGRARFWWATSGRSGNRTSKRGGIAERASRPVPGPW